VLTAVLALGAAAAFSFVPLTIFVLVILSDRHLANGAAYTGGFLLGTATVVLGMTWAVAMFAEYAAYATAQAVTVLRLTSGVLLLVFGLVTFLLRRKQARVPAWIGVLEHLAPPRAIAWGIVAAIANLKNLSLAFSAGAMLASEHSSGSALLGGVAFAVAATSVMGVMLVIIAGTPQRSTRFVSWLRSVLSTHNSGILAVAFLLAGVLMLLSGISVS